MDERLLGTSVDNPDSDYDGITDGDEVLNLGGAAGGYDPLSPDTDGDGYCDLDEFWSCFSVNYNTDSPNAAGWTYWDWDGDGIPNYQDAYPFDPDNGVPTEAVDSDGDGYAGGDDSHEGNAALYHDWNYNGINDEDETPDIDSDGDEIPDSLDSHPTNPWLSSDWDNDGVNDPVDSDNDGHFDQADSDPCDSNLWCDSDRDGFNDDEDADGDGVPNQFDTHPQNADLWSDWNNNGINDDRNTDGDALPDEFDSHPEDNLLWSDWNYNGINDDQDNDGDGVPDESDSHPEDASLWCDWDANGTNDGSDGNSDGDQDGDGVFDSQDSHPDDATLWCDRNGSGVNDDQDSDSDGIVDDYDSHPQDANLRCDWNFNGTNDDQDSDVDGVADDYDSHPWNVELWSDWNGNGLNENWDSDEDSLDDESDSDPWNSSLWSDWDHNGFNEGEEAPPDDDGDGVVNAEDTFPGDPDNGDSDHDGVLDSEESQYGGIVGESDTDGDGLTDGDEVSIGTCCDLADSDGDGLTDYEEVMIYRYQGFPSISPTNSHSLDATYEDYLVVDLTDSDGDTIPDRIEQFYGLDPSSASDTLGDLDGNGLTNADQYAAGYALDVDRSHFDSDHDGMTDIFEIVHHLNPLEFNDAVLDGDGDGLLNFEEALWHTSPTNPDSQFGDGEVMLFGGGTRNGNDFEFAFGPLDANPAPFTVMVRLAPDDWDGDGLPDTWEHRYGFGSSGIRTPNPDEDPDMDGLTNLEEYQLGSNPILPDEDQNGVVDGNDDWDGDGLPNGLELKLGTDPHLADSDGDGTPDGDEDYDGDGVGNLAELSMGRNPRVDDTDTDGDRLTDVEERAMGTEPGNPDSDYDGIADGDEVLSLGGAANGYNSLAWDSDGDGYSDFDEFWSCFSVNYNATPPGNTGWTYRDWDGDGIPNYQDAYPFDPSNTPPTPVDVDADGYAGEFDSDEGNPLLYHDFNRNGINDDDEPSPDADSDGDGVPDASDSHPTNSWLRSDWNNNGINDDQDSDSDGYLDESDSDPTNAALWSDWDHNGYNEGEVNPSDYDSDGDGHPDGSDSDPSNSALWSDWDHNGYNEGADPGGGGWDTDGDGFVDGGDSDAWNALLWSDWDHDGVNDDMESTQDSDADGHLDILDSHRSNASLWSDWNYNGINDEQETSGSGDNPNQDSDGDGYLDSMDSNPSDNILWCDWNYNGINDDGESTGGGGSNPDSDGDGVADDCDSDPANSSLWCDWDHNGINDGSQPTLVDWDGDGLSDAEESILGTDPANTDTDWDGLSDFEEVVIYAQQFPAISPTSKHSLHSVYDDFLSVDLADNDHDTIPNRIEVFYGLNPNLASDGQSDLDGNGISNADQYAAGLALNVDLNLLDSDQDGMTDVFEIVHQLNPHVFEDSVGDNDSDGLLNFEEALEHTSPRLADTHNDPSEVLLPDSSSRNGTDFEARFGALNANPAPFDVMVRLSPSDWDGDGMPDSWEHRYGFSSAAIRSAANTSDDPDNDGMTNLEEYQLGTNPIIQDEDQNGVRDGDDDWDGDGLSNSREQSLGTNPRMADTDGDGESDNDEVLGGTDPLDPASYMATEWTKVSTNRTPRLRLRQLADTPSGWAVVGANVDLCVTELYRRQVGNRTQETTKTLAQTPAVGAGLFFHAPKANLSDWSGVTDATGSYRSAVSVTQPPEVGESVYIEVYAFYGGVKISSFITIQPPGSQPAPEVLPENGWTLTTALRPLSLSVSGAPYLQDPFGNYSLDAGDVTEITSRVIATSWEIWTHSSGATETRNYLSHPAVGANVFFGTDPAPQIADAKGEAKGSFTMPDTNGGYAAVRVIYGSFAPTAGGIQFCPTRTAGGEWIEWFHSTHDRKSLEVKVQQKGQRADVSVTQVTTEIWVALNDTSVPEQMRTISRTIAQGASVHFSTNDPLTGYQEFFQTVTGADGTASIALDINAPKILTVSASKDLAQGSDSMIVLPPCDLPTGSTTGGNPGTAAPAGTINGVSWHFQIRSSNVGWAMTRDGEGKAWAFGAEDVFFPTPSAWHWPADHMQMINWGIAQAGLLKNPDKLSPPIDVGWNLGASYNWDQVFPGSGGDWRKDAQQQWGLATVVIDRPAPAELHIPLYWRVDSYSQSSEFDATGEMQPLGSVTYSGVATIPENECRASVIVMEGMPPSENGWLPVGRPIPAVNHCDIFQLSGDSLLPVDIDLIKPGTEDTSCEEIAEDQEETEGEVVNVNWDDDDNSEGDGGHGKVVFKNDFDDVNGTVGEDDWIQIKLHPVGVADAKTRLKYDPAFVRVWQRSNRLDEVVSEETEFEGNEEKKLYVEGRKATQAGQPTKIEMQIRLTGDGQFVTGDSVSVHVATPIITVYGKHLFTAGAGSKNLALQLYDKQYLGNKRRDDRNNTVILRGKNEHGDALWYSVDMFDLVPFEVGDQEKGPIIRVRESHLDKEMKMALSLEGSHVAYFGHANYGLGPNFKSECSNIDDFMNISGRGMAAIPVYDSDATHPMEDPDSGGPSFRLRDNDALGTVRNYAVPILNLLRFPDVAMDADLERQEIFDIPYHFHSEGKPWMAIVRSEGDVPVLRYQSCFMGACQSARHFSETLDHGTLLCTKVDSYDIVGKEGQLPKDLGTESLSEKGVKSWIITHYVRLLAQGESFGGIANFLNQNQFIEPPRTEPEDASNFVVLQR